MEISYKRLWKLLIDKDLKKKDLEEMAASAALHETDHLEGTLFIDLVDELITDEELQELLDKE